MTPLIPPHGGYKNLLSYQSSTVVHDFTMEFCRRYIDYKSRTKDQMEQAARSGSQNIVEGSQASGTSKKTELKLVGIARASQAELLADYEDFLRQRSLPLWGKEHTKTREIRALAYRSDRSYKTYESYITNPETAANCAICLINQTSFLLDRQLAALEKEFLEKGGFTERLYNERKKRRGF